LVTKVKEACIEESNNLKLKHLYVGEAGTQNFQLFGFNDYYDDCFSKDEMCESKMI
jgi:hypothetical protein